jgi:hypothetical protein
LTKIKPSFKQTVHVPTDFNSMGNQLQLFAAGCEIFFGKESVCSTSVRQLLITIGRNKKTFQDHITLDDLFVAKFMLAANRIFQCWLSMCECTTISQSQVDDRVLQFDSIMEDILNGQFNMTLPAIFNKIKSNPSKVNHKVTASGCGGKGGPEQDKHRKKRVINQELAGSAVRNDNQINKFKMRGGETWDKNFRSQCPKKRPDWNSDAKMCARWHIKGDCYDTCPRAISHVPGNKVPPKHKAIFLTFIVECRECIANGKKD